MEKGTFKMKDMINRYRELIRRNVLILLLAVSLSAVSGCGAAPATGGYAASVSAFDAAETAAAEESAEAGSLSETTADSEADGTTEKSDMAGTLADDDALPEDGYYYSKEEVSEYLHVYHHLPSNYMTKKEARALGWEGGPLEPYATGMAIGGDVFGNYEGNLPEDHTYHECDIDTEGKSRGAKRLVWSDDWAIYYTGDHYETFELLYESEDY